MNSGDSSKGRGGGSKATTFGNGGGVAGSFRGTGGGSGEIPVPINRNTRHWAGSFKTIKLEIVELGYRPLGVGRLEKPLGPM